MASDIAAAASFRPRGEATTGAWGRSAGSTSRRTPSWLCRRSTRSSRRSQSGAKVTSTPRRREWLANLRPLIKSVEFDEVVAADLSFRAPAASPSVPGPTPSPVVSDLAHLVVAAMERKRYQVDRGPGEMNIVYVEGMNPDGT